MGFPNDNGGLCFCKSQISISRTWKPGFGESSCWEVEIPDPVPTGKDLLRLPLLIGGGGGEVGMVNAV